MTESASHKAEQPTEEQFRSAFSDPIAHVRLWVVAVAALALDLWSKSWAFANLGPYDVREVVPKVFEFRRSVNPGALFGMGKGLVPLFIVASFAALGFVLYLFATSSYRQKWLHLSLSLVLAGSLGNLYDRSFIIVDKVVLTDGSDRVCRIVENDPEKPYIMIGHAPDGADRIMLDRAEIASMSSVGVVRDFMKIVPKIGKRDIWPWVFNVADSALVVGVGMLMLNLWSERRTIALRERRGETCTSSA